MNVIDGINLAGIVAVLGFLWKLSSDLKHDIKRLSERAARIEGFPEGKLRTFNHNEIKNPTPKLLTGNPHPMASVMRSPSASQDGRAYEQAFKT